MSLPAEKFTKNPVALNLPESPRFINTEELDRSMDSLVNSVQQRHPTDYEHVNTIMELLINGFRGYEFDTELNDKAWKVASMVIAYAWWSDDLPDDLQEPLNLLIERGLEYKAKR